MPNAIPLLEGTDTSGGYLVREEYSYGLQDGINRLQAVPSLARFDRLIGRRQRYSVYAGRPTAAFVAEGAKKPVTGAEFGEVTLDVKKIATTLIYTEELLEDAKEDPRVLTGADVQGAFADLIDAHALGRQNGAAITSQFNTSLAATTNTVEFDQTKGDAFALAVSAAIAKIRGAGYTPSGIAAGFDVEAHLRDARGAGDNITMPVYGQAGFANGQENATLYGLPVRWTTNLSGLTGTPAAGKVVAIVGAFNNAIMGVRRDMTVRSSNEASLDISGTITSMFQENKTALLWEMRLGFAVHDLNRAFVAIVNAT